MADSGYDAVIEENAKGNLATAVFFKKDKFVLLGKEAVRYDPSESYFFLACHFAEVGGKDKSGKLVADPHKKFLFIETHMKAMPEFADKRLQQARKINEYTTSFMN